MTSTCRSFATVAAAALPLVLLPLGLAAAQAAQPGDDGWSWSLSALASPAATQRWIMVTTLAVLGLCHVAVACGLREVPVVGRILLGTGGALLVVVAAVPQVDERWFTTHIVAGALAWLASTVWPLALVRRDAPARLRRGSLLAVVVVGALVVWFAIELVTAGDRYGLSQRIAIVSLVVWPLRVAWWDTTSR